MKKIFLFFMLAISIANCKAQPSEVVAKLIRGTQRIQLRTRAIDSLVVSITGSSNDRQLPTAKSVYDYVQSAVSGSSGHVIAQSGTGLAGKDTLNFAGDSLVSFVVSNTSTSTKVNARLNQAGATSGQVLKWTSGTWAPGDDNNTTYSAGTGIDVTGTVITNTRPMATGTDKQTIRYNGTTATANSALQNDGTYIGIGVAPNTSYMLDIKQNATTKGLFIERSTASSGLHIFHNNSEARYQTTDGVGHNFYVANTSYFEVRNNSVVSKVKHAISWARPGDGTTEDILSVIPTFSGTQTSGALYGIHVKPVNSGFTNSSSLVGLEVDMSNFSSGTIYGIINRNGNSGFGTATPTAKVSTIGTGTTSSTYSFKAKNSLDSIVMSVRDDRRVGINTESPGVALDVNGSIRNRGLIIEDHNDITGTTTVTASSSITDNLYKPGSTQATLTFNLPATPSDGQLCRVCFNEIVTALTVSGNGTTLTGTAATSAAVGDCFSFKYYNSITAWIRTK